MKHSLAARFDQSAFDSRLVADITLDDNQRLATDFLNAVQRCWIAVAKVVENNDLLTGVEKVNAGMRAHVPGASSYQDHSASLTESGHSSRCHAEPWRKIARLEQHSTVAKSNIVGEMNIVGHR